MSNRVNKQGAVAKRSPLAGPGSRSKGRARPKRQRVRFGEVTIMEPTTNEQAGSQQQPLMIEDDEEEEYDHVPEVDGNNFLYVDIPEILEVEDADPAIVPNHLKTYWQISKKSWKTHTSRDVELRDGTYMRILATDIDDSGERWIRGRRLFPQNTRDLLMPPTAKELVWVSFFDLNGNERKKEVRVRSSEISRDCKIIFTNLPYNVFNRQHIPNSEEGYLFCRWRRILSPKEKDEGIMVHKHRFGKIERLQARDADDEPLQFNGVLICPQTDRPLLRQHWRGPEHCKLQGTALVEVAEGLLEHKYTLGDAFCGAGGVTQGATSAGLAPRFAVDFCAAAIQTYRNMFDGHCDLDIRGENIYNFISVAKRTARYVVDILHMSPPCQPFSRANTTPNPSKNEANTDTLLAVGDLLEVCKPRIVTLEEADGFLDEKHRLWFRKLLSFFVEMEYSLEWKCVWLKHYGVPQSRKRLIIIASGPGEEAVAFPAPTNGTEPGLMPLPSIGEAIADIPFDDELHNLEKFVWFSEEKAEIDPSGVAGTLTCNGGMNVYHPSGERNYTLAELAALQTFPRGYAWSGTKVEIKRQIGNAVPPEFAQRLFDWIRRRMMAADKAEMRG
ncbi:hypothetical protein LTR99_010618 [Exophiala xenobiotica]|uniref:DNA (cytosine-5-)-methyltransferase n=1 Tax=Vermiconidia calcicola TaxID=1690605 RepID=A0AAV9Q619_9PEZI|nr:hypothetical protein LTR99_010618 [Exophiala xenobiotica]KAK5342039.1 hypothetical protein LTR98_002833 [Exophiala xenobiotica]KAK5426103.1 hypothetical protein LTR34_010353 [Exophiala xenobiotica]KAK5533829.1 hypothetical protein LTR25_006809 [Vermiconidia calcicola]KAK5546380.1 hypothetical protein LTR23_003485 [Chaetothyriales sp. CCFEE 6169]